MQDGIGPLIDALTERWPADRIPHVLAYLERLSGGLDDLRMDGLAPGQEPDAAMYVPGLTAKPMWDPRELPHLAELRESWPVILEEFRAVAPDRFGPYLKLYETDAARVVDADWRSLYFQRRFRPTEEGSALCPRTAEILGRMPVANEAMFSLLRPGAHIEAHTDSMNFVLVVHLGLVIPDGCEIRTAEGLRRWAPGEMMVFDTTFEHEAWNRSDQERTVLLVDVWHPELTPEEIEAIGLLRPRIEAAFGFGEA
jgi:aspartyl/asparaginyl beta-hydroxylase (cupin superfamily)